MVCTPGPVKMGRSWYPPTPLSATAPNSSMGLPSVLMNAAVSALWSVRN